MTIAAAFLLVVITLAAIAFTMVRRWVASEPPPTTPPTTTITAGNGAQVNLGHARDIERVECETYTNIQVFEDTLANLSQAQDVLELGCEIVEAARDGRYNGDLVAAFDGILKSAMLATHAAAFITRQARGGDYAFKTTMGEIAQEIREHVYKDNGDHP